MIQSFFIIAYPGKKDNLKSGTETGNDEKKEKTKKCLHVKNVCDIVIFAVRLLTDIIWLRGQAVKTLASHAGIRGSIPLGVTEKARFYGLFSCLENESAPNVRLGIEESKMLKEEILDVFLPCRVYSYGLFFYYG